MAAYMYESRRLVLHPTLVLDSCIGFVEPDAMPGKRTFVAGFAQGEIYLFYRRLLTHFLANVGDTSPNT